MTRLASRDRAKLKKREYAFLTASCVRAYVDDECARVLLYMYEATRRRGLALPFVIIDESKARSFLEWEQHFPAALQANFREKFNCDGAARRISPLR